MHRDTKPVERDRPAQSGGPAGPAGSGSRGSPWQASLPLATAGVELAGIVGGMIGIGYLLDYWLGLFPLFLIVGAVIGIVGGLYRTIRKAMPPRNR